MIPGGPWYALEAQDGGVEIWAPGVGDDPPTRICVVDEAIADDEEATDAVVAAILKLPELMRA